MQKGDLKAKLGAIARNPTLRHDFLGTAMSSWGVITP